MTVQTRPISPSQRRQTLVMFLIISASCIAIPAYFTCVELGYKLFGITTTAKLTGSHQESRSAGRSGGYRTVDVIDYTFRESGGRQRDESQVLAENLATNSGGQVTVEYIPRLRGYSRILGSPTHWQVCLIMVPYGSFFGLMAWFVWRQKDAKPTITKAAPAKSEPELSELRNPPVVWSQQDRRNSLIVCVVAALIIVVSLLLDRGAIGLMITFVILFALCALFAMDQQIRITRKRTHSMWSLAQELTWDFAADGNEKLHQGLSRFHLATLGQTSTLTNLMYGRCDGTDVAMFDYGYTQGKSGAAQTVVWMQRRGEQMTEFSLRPESVWNQLGGWTAHGDINFDSHPEFSRSYLLRGDDEEAIRELFTDNVLRFYERHPNLITEGSGTKLLFYRDRVVVKPENLRSFLDEALAVRALFQPASDV